MPVLAGAVVRAEGDIEQRGERHRSPPQLLGEFDAPETAAERSSPSRKRRLCHEAPPISTSDKRWLCNGAALNQEKPTESRSLQDLPASSAAKDDLLFFGCLPVRLAQAPGEILGLPAAWCEPPGRDEANRRAAAASQVRARLAPLRHLGDEYSNAVVPATPACDWEPLRDARLSLTRWPQALLRGPLVKVPKLSHAAASPGSMHGIASGLRSALVKVDGRWWRLKGCGNLDGGFPVETRGKLGEVSVRGCCFEHTANTEMRMAALAAEVLESCGLDVANRPVGLYHYSPQTSWPLPKIGRYCVVFETLGNVRLGAHLIAGLLRLLPDILPVPADGFAAIHSALDESRGAEPSDLWPTAQVAACGMATVDVAGKLAEAGAKLEETAPAAADVIVELPTQLRSTWDEARAGLGAQLTAAKKAAREPSLLLWLAWRLGWECGAVVLALHKAGVAWGTYADSMGIHCNAHVDNLIVKPPGTGKGTSFLAACDFDMAFTRECYLPEVASTPPGLCLDTWDGLLAFEASMGMKTVLAGHDYSNTGVPNTASVPESHSIIETALRDTLVTAYDAAYAGGRDAHPPHSEMRAAAYELVKLALCLTTHIES